MTVSSSTNRVSYAGNGSTTVFPYTYKIFDEDDLTVILRAANGTETVQTITSQYTVSGVGNAGGGNVTMLTAPASGTTLVILREQDLVQGLDIVPNDPFPADSLEGALDKLTFMVQQHEETLGRTIKASRTNTISSTEFTISAANRANKIFGFDAAGDLSITQELGTNRGDWAASTAYNQRDIVKDGGNDNLYFCNTSHTSSGSLPISSNTDAAKWDLLLDVSAFTTLYDQFDDRYLGAKSSDPATDNDGNTLIDGALYWNTTDNRLKVYDLGNTAWVFTAPTSTEQTAINAVAAIAADVSAVAAIDSDVTAVAADATDIGTVATNISDVSTVAGISADVTAVVADEVDIGIVATNIADVSTVAGISSSVSTVAGIDTEVAAVAGDATDIGVVAADIADVNTVAGISANVTTVAGISANVTTVAGISAAVSTAAANVADITNFADVYLGPKTSNPATRNDSSALQAGDLYFNTVSDQMFVYDGAAWLSTNYVSSNVDINGGTIDGTVIGGSTPAAISGTTGTFSGDVSIADKIVHTGDTNTAIRFPAADTVTVETAGSERMRIDSSGNVVIGSGGLDTSGIGGTFTALNMRAGSGYPVLYGQTTATSTNSAAMQIVGATSGASAGGAAELLGVIQIAAQSDSSTNAEGYINFYTGSGGSVTEHARIDASGNLLVGKTSASGTTVGAEMRAAGTVIATVANDYPLYLNRTSSDGEIAQFRKDGTTVGSIGSFSDDVYIGNNTTGLRFIDSTFAITPFDPADLQNSDNQLDLGANSARFDDIFATNGTIQTSDRNEKQDIEALSEAEQRVAVACKGLLRKFRWKSAVEEKGDDARIHFGIIAQDLQAAFAAEGLDAGRYAMFIHSTWVDEETGEERSRMGVRYPQLLAFIIAAI